MSTGLIGALRNGPESRIRLTVKGEAVWDGTMESLAEEWPEVQCIERVDFCDGGGVITVRDGWNDVAVSVYKPARRWWQARLIVSLLAALGVLGWIWAALGV